MLDGSQYSVKNAFTKLTALSVRISQYSLGLVRNRRTVVRSLRMIKPGQQIRMLDVGCGCLLRPVFIRVEATTCARLFHREIAPCMYKALTLGRLCIVGLKGLPETIQAVRAITALSLSISSVRIGTEI